MIVTNSYSVVECIHLKCVAMVTVKLLGCVYKYLQTRFYIGDCMFDISITTSLYYK